MGTPTADRAKEQRRLYHQMRRRQEIEIEHLRQKLSDLGDDQGPDQVEERRRLESNLKLAEMSLGVPGSLLVPSGPPPRFPARDFGLEDFIHAFSADGAEWAKDSPNEILENVESVGDSLLQILGKPFNRPINCWNFLLIAKYQYRETRNPLWPWMVLGIYSRACLLPPSWVWEYFLSATLCVRKGAGELRPFKEPRDKTTIYSDQKFIELLGLKRAVGKRDHFTEFRQVITDLRLALRVRDLAFPETSEKRVGLMEACRRVADGAKTEKRRVPQKDARAEKKQVWKAYDRWFEKDGCFRLIPNPR